MDETPQTAHITFGSSEETIRSLLKQKVNMTGQGGNSSFKMLCALKYVLMQLF